MRKKTKLKFPTKVNWLYISALAVFVIALIARLPLMSHGMDQWDVVLYKNSLVHMSFYREAQWPLLLLFQKGLWLIFPGLSVQEILSLTNIILGAATLAIFFGLARRISGSYVLSLILTCLLFIMPLFGVYTVVGMQDMAQTFAVTVFIAAIVRFCYSRQIGWLYAASAIAGLDLGVRVTLILLMPSLVLAAVLVLGIKYRIYLRAAAWFVLGAGLGLVGDLFIAPLKNSDPVGFFLSQFHTFSPSVLGYWVKAGNYSLLSGYKLTLFYWLPALWFVAYLIALRHRSRLKSGPIIALVASCLSLAVAYGLNRILRAPPASWVYLLEIIVLGLGIIYELIKTWPQLLKTGYIKKADPREKATLILSCLMITYVAFDYIFTGAVSRYFLPLIPATFLLILLLTSRYGWKSWAFIFLATGFIYWVCPFGRSQTIVGAFKQLDPRSAVAGYIGSHSGKFYDFDNTAGSYLESLGVAQRTQPPFGPGCLSLDTKQTNYAIFYGPADSTLVNSCPNFSFVQVARFQRNEAVIEDSIGNIGLTVYQILPRH